MAKLELLTSRERNSSLEPIPEQIPISAQDCAGGGLLGLPTRHVTPLKSGRSVETLGAATGEGAPGPTKKPVVKKK